MDTYRPYTVNGSLWSLSYEVACYLALLGLFCLVSRNKIVANLLILAIFIDTAFRLKLLFGFMSPDHPEARLLPLAFAAGASLAVNADSLKIDFKLPLAFALFSVIFWNSGMNELFFMLFICFSAVTLSSLPAVRRIPIQYDLSYGIYLWGFFVQQVLNHYLGPVNIYLYMIYSLYVTSIFGFISFVLIEQPFMRLGKTLQATRSNSQVQSGPAVSLS
jgi:peptidoglycan/LPS O-acetylase OafA/YrhL